MECYDVAIIGTGAGGGTLAWALAPTGKKILLLERGEYVAVNPALTIMASALRVGDRLKDRLR